MDEEITGFWLPQSVHIRCHLWHKCSIASYNDKRKTSEVMKLLGTLGSVASLFAATLYQGNHDRNYWQALEYRMNWEIYIPYAGAAGMSLHINRKFTMGKRSCRKGSFLIGSNWQLDVGQGI